MSLPALPLMLKELPSPRSYITSIAIPEIGRHQKIENGLLLPLSHVLKTKLHCGFLIMKPTTSFHGV